MENAVIQKSRINRKQCIGTVYHDNTVEKPQNVCPVCGEQFLFQLQLRIHLETHEDENSEESLDDLPAEIEINNAESDDGSDNRNPFTQIEELTKTESSNVAGHQNNSVEIFTQIEASDTSGVNVNTQFAEMGTAEHEPDCRTHANDCSEMVDALVDTERMPEQTTELEGQNNRNSEFQDAVHNELVSIENDIFINQISDNVTNGTEDDHTMDIDYGMVEEINKSTVIENDVNLGEVISQIKEGEKNQGLNDDSDLSDGTELIVMNKNNGKLNRKPDSSKLRHECHICNEMFQWPYQLKRHINMHNGLYPYKCDICGRKFDRASSLRDHGMVHRKDRPFECEVCHVRFTLRNNLTKHMNRHTKEKVWQCEHCRKRFLQRDQLIAHLIVHKGEKPFPCEVCGKAFARKTNLKEHMITHSTEKKYPCDYCHKTFSKPYSKKVHMRHHLNTKPHKCDVCGASFSQSCALVTHIRRHTGERPFACPMCPRSFAQQSTLQTHVAIHTGEKNFKCGVCTKAFLRKRSLTEHMRMHTGEKPFKCMLCDFTTATKVGLKKHTETHVKQLIRNADIDLTGLIDLPKLDNNDAVNQNDLTSLCENVEKTNKSFTNDMIIDNENMDDVTGNNAFNEEQMTNNMLDFDTDGILDNTGLSKDTDSQYQKPDATKALKESTDQALNIETLEQLTGENSEERKDAEKESLVYTTGLNIIVSEINKHCKGQFDPQLLDESFVRHIINQSSLLSQTSNKHTREPTRFECEVCGIVLPHKKLMTEHMKTHKPVPEKRKHICELCGKRFLHRKSLRIHFRTHTGERPYKCEMCDATFTNKRALQKHYQNIHKGIVVVNSAQEYAEALAEKKDIEDLDSFKPENVPITVEKQKKVKTVPKAASVSGKKKTVRNRGKKKHVSSEIGAQHLNSCNDKNLQVNNAEVNILESAEDILKQAELAAKSICESLFTANMTTNEQTASKPTFTSNSVSLGARYSSVMGGLMAKSDKSNKNVNDSYSLLRKALQGVNNDNHSANNDNQAAYNKLIQVPVFNQVAKCKEEIQEPSEAYDTSSLNFLRDKQADCTPVIGKTIQNEYETLRRALQKSVNSVMITPLLDD